MAGIRIDRRDMAAFAGASGDCNPLHFESAPVQSGDEGPVVYGVLAALAAVGELPGDGDQGLRALDVTFARPLRVGAEYEVDSRRQAPARYEARICDGDLLAVRVDARFAGSDGSRASVGRAERLQRPIRRRIEELERGEALSGDYGGEQGSLEWLRGRFQLPPAAVGDYALHSLLYASYLVGMLIPGEGAMMSSLRLRLAGSPPDPAAPEGEPLSFRVAVVEARPQARTITVSGELTHVGRPIANLTCEAHQPQAPERLDAALLAAELGGTSSLLAGRTAVVVGASRGFGSVLAHGLASQGCRVHAFSRTGGEEEQPPVEAGWSGLIDQQQGDARDPDHCRRLLERAGPPDFLLCCAAPRLNDVGFGATSVRRFNSFVQQSTELVSVPIATMIGAIGAKTGLCLVVSSQAVRTMPREWGHYVAAKGAVEALAAWTAKWHPAVELLVARPPQMNAGLLGAGVVRREVVAAWLLRRLIDRAGSGAHLLEWPPEPQPAAS